jgi:hypothetical protein
MGTCRLLDQHLGARKKICAEMKKFSREAKSILAAGADSSRRSQPPSCCVANGACEWADRLNAPKVGSMARAACRSIGSTDTLPREAALPFFLPACLTARTKTGLLAPLAGPGPTHVITPAGHNRHSRGRWREGNATPANPLLFSLLTLSLYG